MLSSRSPGYTLNPFHMVPGKEKSISTEVRSVTSGAPQERKEANHKRTHRNFLGWHECFVSYHSWGSGYPAVSLTQPCASSVDFTLSKLYLNNSDLKTSKQKR